MSYTLKVLISFFFSLQICIMTSFLLEDAVSNQSPVQVVVMKNWILCKRKRQMETRKRTGPHRAACVFNNHSILST